MLHEFKSRTKVFLLLVIRAFLFLCYMPMKLFRTDSKKILFLSRQSDVLSLDASLLIEELKKRCPDVRVVCICCRVKRSPASKIIFATCLMKSLYHLATSKVCVLDSYWPPVSLLNHKPELRVIQMWHALGKIKQSGRQALDQPGGRDGETARVLKMHHGYDFVIAGGKRWNRFYAEAFGVPETAIRNVGLPRIDYLLQNSNSIRKNIFSLFPDLSEKPVILYAPTFRRVGKTDLASLLDALDLEKYCVVVKPHPNQAMENDCRAKRCPSVSAMELLTVAEYLITDYSAIALEAAALRVKTLYYAYDYELYKRTTGMNVDLYEEMPGCVFESAIDLSAALSKPYPFDAFERYRDNFLFDCIGKSTESIADVVFDEAGLASKGEGR